MTTIGLNRTSSKSPTDMYETLRPKKRRGIRNRGFVMGLIGIVGGLVIWQVLASTHLINPTFSSSPIGAGAALVKGLQTGTLWSAIGGTLGTFAIGLVICIVIAIPIGLVLGRTPVLRELFEPWIAILYAVPYVVFLPLIIFWFGIDTTSRLVLIVWSGALPLLIATIGAARNLDGRFLAVATVFNASRLYTLRTVVFPASLPYILGGVRLALGRGLVGAIVAELFLGSVGLGNLVQTQTSNFQMDDAMATIAVIAVIAIVINQAVGLLERRFANWADSTAG